MSADSTGFDSSISGFARLVLSLVFALAFQTAVLAEQPCPLGLLVGSDPGAPDGVKGTGWNDATSVASGSACLGLYTDLNGGIPGSRTLTISSKRYSRGGVSYAGFLFEVPDLTTSQPGGLPLFNGEKIILQLHRDVSGGNTLTGSGASASEYKIEITHKWDTTTGTPNDGLHVGSKVELYAGATAAPCNPVDKQHWSPYTPPAADQPTAAVTNKLPNGSGGYTAEIEVPLSLLGSPAGDIGIAILVLNDTGSNCTGTSCDAYGAAFPDSLAVRNGEVPLQSLCTSWNKPDNWGTGYASTPPGDVFFVHTPVYWNSVDIAAMHCTTEDNNWYNQQRCQLSVRANLRNSFGSSQTRNVLYLWGDPGMGQLTWRVVEMRENIAAAVGETSVTSSSAHIDVAVAPTDHPCVRAYVLPTAYPTGWSKAIIEGFGPNHDGAFTDAELTTLISAYGVGIYDQHSAQENMTRIDGQNCPDAGCLAWFDGSPGTRLAFAPSSDGLGLPRYAGGFGLIGMAQAQERVGKAGGTTGDGAAGRILMSGRNLERYAGENVIIQVREFAATPAPADNTSPYNILEEVAGVIKMVPVRDLGKPVPFVFTVGNPGKVARAISLHVDTLAPSGVQAPAVHLPSSLGTMQPGEEHRVKAVIGRCGYFDIVCWIELLLLTLDLRAIVALLVLLLVIVGVIWLLRRRRP